MNGNNEYDVTYRALICEKCMATNISYSLLLTIGICAMISWSVISKPKVMGLKYNLFFTYTTSPCVSKKHLEVYIIVLLSLCLHHMSHCLSLLVLMS